MYVYISILKLIETFPEYFPRSRAIEYGHKKMRYITEGVSAIDKRVQDEKTRSQVKLRVFQSIEPTMPSTEIESKIEDIVEDS